VMEPGMESGNKDVTIPAESALSFKLAQTITVKMPTFPIY